MRIVSAVAAILLVACSAPRPSPPPPRADAAASSFATEGPPARAASIPPIEGRIEVDAAPARAVLDVLGGARPAPGVERVLSHLAYAIDVGEDRARDELRRAGTDEDAVDDAFAFVEARRHLDDARARVDDLALELESREDVVKSRVQRLLPEEAGDGPPLHVWIVVGLPPERPTALVPIEDERLLLLDARQLFLDVFQRTGRYERDAVGEELVRIVAPELFIVRFESYADQTPAWAEATTHDAGRFLLVLLTEGVAGYLSLPEEERFDDQGRRTPAFDAEARGLTRRFGENVLMLFDDEADPEARRALRWSALNGPRKQRWGTYVVSLMVDAVVRFGAPDRMRAVLREGPAELVDAYSEVAGRLAAVPPLSDEVRSEIARVGSRASH